MSAVSKKNLAPVHEEVEYQKDVKVPSHSSGKHTSPASCVKFIKHNKKRRKEPEVTAFNTNESEEVIWIEAELSI